MFYDSRNMPIVIENAVGLSRLYLFRLRGNVVHKNVVRAFQVVALKEHKSARDGSKTLLINPVNNLHARRVELEDQLTHHGCLLSVAWPTGTNSVPAGCSSLNRSLGISSFMLTFVTCKSSL